MRTTVAALVGTDHHPFERLVDWMDASALRHPDVRFVVQHGTTRRPRVAEGQDFLRHDELCRLLADASVVVCHGGPGLIIEAREAGHVPLCLPRDPDHGEHVDGHQQRFAAFLGSVGAVRNLRTRAEFDRELDHALLLGGLHGAVSLGELRHVARARAVAELSELMAAGRLPGVRRRRQAVG